MKTKTPKAKKPSIYTTSKKDYATAKRNLVKLVNNHIVSIRSVTFFMRTNMKGAQFLQCFIDLNPNDITEAIKSRMKPEDLYFTKIRTLPDKSKKREFLRYADGRAIPIEKFSMSKIIQVIEYLYTRKTSLSEENYKKIKNHLIKAYKDHVGSVDFLVRSINTTKSGNAFLRKFAAHTNPLHPQDIWLVMPPEIKYITQKRDLVDGTSKITYTYNANGKVIAKQYFKIEDIVKCAHQYYENKFYNRI